MASPKIIPMGRDCRITFQLRHLWTETSLFEWVWTDTLSDINIIIKKLKNNEIIKITRMNANDYMDDTNIKTKHYTHVNYEEIVERRGKRLMDDIRKSESLLFIRDDVLGNIKKEEISEFFDLIKEINPNLKFKMLLFSREDKYNEITFPNVHHKAYSGAMHYTYIHECLNAF